MCTEHQWCTELIRCAQNSSARCTELTELVRGAQNSSAVHGTRQCCTEPTTAVHRTRWNPRSRCTSPRAARSAQCVAVARRVRDARDRPGPPGPSPTAPAPPCTHHEPLGIQPMTSVFDVYRMKTPLVLYCSGRRYKILTDTSDSWLIRQTYLICQNPG